MGAGETGINVPRPALTAHTATQLGQPIRGAVPMGAGGTGISAPPRGTTPILFLLPLSSMLNLFLLIETQYYLYVVGLGGPGMVLAAGGGGGRVGGGYAPRPSADSAETAPRIPADTGPRLPRII